MGLIQGLLCLRGEAHLPRHCPLSLPYDLLNNGTNIIKIRTQRIQKREIEGRGWSPCWRMVHNSKKQMPGSNGLLLEQACFDLGKAQDVQSWLIKLLEEMVLIHSGVLPLNFRKLPSLL